MTNYADMDTNEAGGTVVHHLGFWLLSLGEENKYVIAQDIRRWLTVSPSESSPVWIINHHLKDPGRKSVHNYNSYILGPDLGLLCTRGKTVNTTPAVLLQVLSGVLYISQHQKCSSTS